jgi:hypothetical protein
MPGCGNAKADWSGACLQAGQNSGTEDNSRDSHRTTQKAHRRSKQSGSQLAARWREGQYRKKNAALYSLFVDDCVYWHIGVTESGHIPRFHYEQVDGISRNGTRFGHLLRSVNNSEFIAENLVVIRKCEGFAMESTAVLALLL